MNNNVTYIDIMEAISRGWCRTTTQNIVMNVDLAEAICDEVMQVIKGTQDGKQSKSTQENE